MDKEYGSILQTKKAKPSRSLILMGASGSVGGTVLRYLTRCQTISLKAVTVHSSIEKLTEILHQFPSICYAAVTSDKLKAADIAFVRQRFSHVKFYLGSADSMAMLDDATADGADTIVTAVVGAAGIRFTIRAIELGLKIALANKETMVVAGPALRRSMELHSASPGIHQSGSSIVPVDSEHNALFQLVLGKSPESISHLILTASGGPFYEKTEEELCHVTHREVLDHPTWNMGPKITVDSAGMINKGLEVIEAHYLFNVPYERIGVYVHRKSLVHAMLECSDGSLHMHASAPDMIFPVAHALHFPAAVPAIHRESVPPDQWQPLSFEKVEANRFPGFFLALEAGRAGGTAPAIFNGANETAVELFLKGIIRFTDIPDLIQLVLGEIAVEYGEDLELFIEADRRARSAVNASARRLHHN